MDIEGTIDLENSCNVQKVPIVTLSEPSEAASVANEGGD